MHPLLHLVFRTERHLRLAAFEKALQAPHSCSGDLRSPCIVLLSVQSALENAHTVGSLDLRGGPQKFTRVAENRHPSGYTRG